MSSVLARLAHYPPIGEKLEHVPIHVRHGAALLHLSYGIPPETLELYLHLPWEWMEVGPA